MDIELARRAFIAGFMTAHERWNGEFFWPEDGDEQLLDECFCEWFRTQEQGE